MSLTPHKGPEAFRTISEASSEIGVPQHVLRFWETKFAFIRPMKRAGGRRFYRPQDLDVLKGVRALLQEEGYTIKGVQRLHKEGGVRRLVAAADPAAAEGPFEAPEPDDAFAEAAELPTAAPAALKPVERVARPVLDAEARERLKTVLADLEGAKGAIDALLRAGPKD